jgi:hypothetical protein
MSSRAVSVASPSPSRGRSLAFGGTFVLLALLTACVALVPHMAFVAISACYLGLFLAYLGLRPDPQGGYLFEVIVPFGVLSFLYFGVGTMYIVIVPEALERPALMPFLLPAQALLTLGFGCFLVGYGWFFRRTAPSPLGRFFPRSVLVYLVPAAMGALGMSLEKFQNEGMLHDRGISPAISFLQQFGPLFFFGWFLAWYMLWAKRLRPSVAWPVLLLMSAMTLVVLFFTFGGKGLAAMLLGMPALAYYEVKRKLPLKSILVVVLLFVFIIFPMYNNFRQMDRNLGMSRRVDQAFNTVRTWNSDKYMDASVFAFLKRLSIVTSVAAIISDTGRWVDYRKGETLILAPIGLLIPRFLWPDKPNMSIGREFGETFRLKGAMDRETYISPSFVGEFYWNFALPGVVLGMLLLGMVYRWYYQRFGAGVGFDPLRKSIYYTLLPTALSFEGNVAYVFGTCAKAVIILVVFLLLCRRLGWLSTASDH